jgi:hypothetical protein
LIEAYHHHHAGTFSTPWVIEGCNEVTAVYDNLRQETNLQMERTCKSGSHAFRLLVAPHTSDKAVSYASDDPTPAHHQGTSSKDDDLNNQEGDATSTKNKTASAVSRTQGLYLCEIT